MKINEKFDISATKVEALMIKIKELGICLDDIDESFSRGSGKGGQKINKTSSSVHLHHIPTGLNVTCQRERQRNKNRFIALRALVEKIDEHLHPGTTEKSAALAKIRKQKSRRRRKSDKKHNVSEQNKTL
ncbi:MAG: peptide chain release factor-like protein [Waddliaceae bacterium]|jgi:peptide chain release factor|nr:peptide chain release factor-like protein [Waddliaceae bacterium]MBT3578493.1 peptide chain release factor-like protein [Waddliaceae bacterium]MBT4445152.1 peptide chain release factor-like protein [Waddliaceae bacterium]MBT6927970.1 peptide chain release factor-like protein [Waddliaceae bacterium]MBT7263914.1 peptide chain release factor-like protein [Waddliaceae bacterium]